LAARAGTIETHQLISGMYSIDVPASRGALLYVPAVSNRDAGLPLMVSLHGAGGDANHGIQMMRAYADKYGFAVLAPASSHDTWDVIVGAYGPDVRALDHCLSYTFGKVKVRADVLAISGFSDGASYALSLGVSNGDLFSHVIAFSPGFMAPARQEGKPRIFMSHGIRDTVLPIERCSRMIAPRLRRSGYDVQYREFDGPHTVPENIKNEAIRWWNLIDLPPK